MARDLLGRDLRVGVGHGEDDRLVGHGGDHGVGEAPLADRPMTTSAPTMASASVRASVGTACPDFHWFMPLTRPCQITPWVSHKVTLPCGMPMALISSAQAMPAAPAPLITSRGIADRAAGEVERVDQAGGGDDGGAVLVVMEYRDRHQLAQALLDDEAFRRLDVLEVDPAEGGPEHADAVHEFVDVGGVDLEVDAVDVGEALEQDRLALHHRLGGESAQVAQAQDGRAIGDDGHQIAAGGVVVGGVGILLDREAGRRDAGRVGERQVAGGGQRLGGRDLDLARTAPAVQLEGFLGRDTRTRANLLGPFQPVVLGAHRLSPRRLPDRCAAQVRVAQA